MRLVELELFPVINPWRMAAGCPSLSPSQPLPFFLLLSHTFQTETSFFFFTHDERNIVTEELCVRHLTPDSERKTLPATAPSPTLSFKSFPRNSTHPWFQTLTTSFSLDQLSSDTECTTDPLKIFPSCHYKTNMNTRILMEMTVSLVRTPSHPVSWRCLVLGTGKWLFKPTSWHQNLSSTCGFHEKINIIPLSHWRIQQLAFCTINSIHV